MAGKHGGGAWKVAYADFVTAMMAFFLVMWITSQSEKVKEAIAHHFNEPFDSSVPSEYDHEQKGGPNRYEPALPSRNDRSRFPPAIKSPNDDDKDPTSRRPRMLTLREGDRTRTGSVVFFVDDSPELDAPGQERLKRLVPWIAGKPQKLEIRGHASRKPLPPGSPYKDAWQLSYARCLTVMKLLEKHGIPPERMRLSQAGGYEPCTLELNDHERLPDGRVEIYLLDELAENFAQTRDRGKKGAAGR
ncbi:MAG TPA: flagellar motor protein MotB [Pirellulaceae bacterium]|nr:flagellar motor protein MotB [Pirellulaceae bacterium]